MNLDNQSNKCKFFRLVFWNAGGLGWSIGKSEYLKTGSYWHKSGADAEEPWMTSWENGVVVKCNNQLVKSENGMLSYSLIH